MWTMNAAAWVVVLRTLAVYGAVFVGLRATVHDLDHSLDRFYATSRFADNIRKQWPHSPA